MTSFTSRVNEKMGSVKDRALAVDGYLRVKGAPEDTVYAIGDCSTIDNPKLTQSIVQLFEEADTDKNGVLDKKEFTAMVDSLIAKYPQIQVHLEKLRSKFSSYDLDHSDTIDLDELRLAMKDVDKSTTTLPAVLQYKR